MTKTAHFAAVIACAMFTGCASTDTAFDKGAEAADKFVTDYQGQFCNPTGCAENRLACALPSGAMVRVLNADQLSQVRAFIDDTQGTCKR